MISVEKTENNDVKAKNDRFRDDFGGGETQDKLIAQDFGLLKQRLCNHWTNREDSTLLERK